MLTPTRRLALSLVLFNLWRDPSFRRHKNFPFWRDAAGLTEKRLAEIDPISARNLYNKLVNNLG